MQFPADGYALNRIVKLSGIIQQTLITILQSEDALVSWTEKFDSLYYIDSDLFDVKGEGKTLQIIFPFNDISTEEIQPEKLADKIMAVL